MEASGRLIMAAFWLRIGPRGSVRQAESSPRAGLAGGRREAMGRVCGGVAEALGELRLRPPRQACGGHREAVAVAPRGLQ